MMAKRSALFILFTLILSVAASSAFAMDGKKKQPKNTGTLSVKTSPMAMQMRVDGVDQGMTGVGEGREVYLAPGFHTLEVIAADGKVWKQEVEIRKGQKHCICLKSVSETFTKACPYRFHLEGPDKITEGDMVTFAAIPDMSSPVPLKYAWKVSPDSARIVNGAGTPSITVDSTGMGGSTINAELDVNDDVYDNRCRQIINVPTEVGKIAVVNEPKPVMCDEFEARTADDDKARLDNCVIQAQNTPDAQIYMIIYPGSSKASAGRNSYDRVYKRALDYMVKNRGFDPRRITIVRGTERTNTTYSIWIVPPGAKLPMIQ